MDKNKKYIRHDPDDWSTRRAFLKSGEMPRTLANASVMLTLLRHADRIKIGCATSGLAQLCATDRDHVWKSAAYYPFTQLIRYARGVSLRPVVECDTYDVEGYAIDDMNQYAGFENVPYIHSAAAMDDAKGEMAVFVINADNSASHELTLDTAAFAGREFKEHIAMYSEDPDTYNDFYHTDAICPAPVVETECRNGVVNAVLQPLSWNLFLYKKA